MITRPQWISILNALLIARDVYKVKRASEAVEWAKGHIEGWPKRKR